MKRLGVGGVGSWRLKVLAKGAGLALLVMLASPFALTFLYKFVDPPISAYMLRQKLTGERQVRYWRDLDSISPNLIVHVIVAEDSRFCAHSGVDFGAIDDAIADVEEGGRARGASTLSMQTAKNLFLWNKPALLRKVFEVPLAMYMDIVLGKRRMLEIYLNIVEWGPGIYGAEAAARYHFKTTAAMLDGEQAARLAAALPNPITRNAGHPSPRFRFLIQHLRRRALAEQASARCVLRASRRSINPPSIGID